MITILRRHGATIIIPLYAILMRHPAYRRWPASLLRDALNGKIKGDEL